jgi:hypothetical protein
MGDMYKREKGKRHRTKKPPYVPKMKEEKFEETHLTEKSTTLSSPIPFLHHENQETHAENATTNEKEWESAT